MATAILALGRKETELFRLGWSNGHLIFQTTHIGRILIYPILFQIDRTEIREGYSRLFATRVAVNDPLVCTNSLFRSTRIIIEQTQLQGRLSGFTAVGASFDNCIESFFCHVMLTAKHCTTPLFIESSCQMAAIGEFPNELVQRLDLIGILFGQSLQPSTTQKGIITSGRIDAVSHGIGFACTVEVALHIPTVSDTGIGISREIRGNTGSGYILFEGLQSHIVTFGIE